MKALIGITRVLSILSLLLVTLFWIVSLGDDYPGEGLFGSTTGNMLLIYLYFAAILLLSYYAGKSRYIKPLGIVVFIMSILPVLLLILFIFAISKMGGC